MYCLPYNQKQTKFRKGFELVTIFDGKRFPYISFTVLFSLNTITRVTYAIKTHIILLDTSHIRPEKCFEPFPWGKSGVYTRVIQRIRGILEKKKKIKINLFFTVFFFS